MYPPEPVVSAHIGADLAAHLAQYGTVTVLCPFPTRPHGATYPDFTPRAEPWISREQDVEIVRLPSFTAPESRLLPRVCESYSFGRHVCRYLEGPLRKVDVVYANGWPLLSQALIARWCVRRQIPLVLHIQDIYPESLLNKLPRYVRTFVAPPLFALERKIVHSAANVVVISPNMRRTYVDDRQLSPTKVVTIFNWQDERGFANVPSKEEARREYGVPQDRLTFLYLGNIGPVAGVELLIQAFRLAALPNAQLLVIGEGSNKGKCITLAQQLGVEAIRFLSCPPGDAALMQQMADVCLLPVRRGGAMSSVPSKLVAYLFSAKPVIAAVDAESDTAACLRAAECGWIGAPEDTDWMAARMAEVAMLSGETLMAMGERGRSYGLTHFSKAENVRRLASVVLAASEH